jgi:hypothetical protein
MGQLLIAGALVEHLSGLTPDFLDEAVAPLRELSVAVQLLDRIAARVEVAFATQEVCHGEAA